MVTTVDVDEMIDRDKYIVFKKAEFNEFWGSIVPDSDYIEPIRDAVVIRLQDVFAVSGLYAYSNAIMTTLEIGLALDSMDDKTVERLQALADYFAALAEESGEMNRKVPD